MSIFKKIVEGADFISSIPEETAAASEKINRLMIEIARDIEAATAEASARVEKNLRQQEINATGRRAANWLQQPKNVLLTAGAALALIVLIRKL